MHDFNIKIEIVSNKPKVYDLVPFVG